MLVEKLLDLNVYELRFFSVICKEKIMKTGGINLLKLNLDWPSVRRDGNEIIILIYP